MSSNEPTDRGKSRGISAVDRHLPVADGKRHYCKGAESMIVFLRKALLDIGWCAT